MAPDPQSPRARLRALRAELRYWQCQARMEARLLRASRAKCKVIGAAMCAACAQARAPARRGRHRKH